MADSGPIRIDDKGEDRIVGMTDWAANELEAYRPDKANLGLGIQGGGKSPDGALDLDREAGKSGKEAMTDEALLEWDVAAETVTGDKRRVNDGCWLLAAHELNSRGGISPGEEGLVDREGSE